jgi:L-threonylcarbamoyladenylate synthase
MNPIADAVAILQSGGLVAFPTETVYGLGADATNSDAVRKIFAAKGRPATNPLICHVANGAVARRYVRSWPEIAQKLAEAFWPGPLTLVLPKESAIADEVTAGLSTVGVRAPDHPLTLELLRAFDGPLAGPSANRSNHVSPTSAQHVREDLNDRVDLILDGGPCGVGIESTVLDLASDEPMLLRPGGISRAQIERIIGPVRLDRATTDAAIPARAPGQHPMHYAPTTPAFRFERSDRDRLLQRFESDSTAAFALLLIDPTVRGLLVPADPEREGPGEKLALPLDPILYARKLYETRRMLEGTRARAIYIELPPDTPEWTAVRDRLIRATRPLDDSPFAEARDG